MAILRLLRMAVDWERTSANKDERAAAVVSTAGKFG